MVTDPFVRMFQADRDDLVAARWWNETLKHDPVFLRALQEEGTRRAVLAGLGIGAAGLVLFIAAAADRQQNRVDVREFDALTLQRRDGWNVGAAGQRLYLFGLRNTDAQGSTDWFDHLNALESAVVPASPALLPYYVPTLFRVLDAGDCRAALSPIYTTTMEAAEHQARALGDLFRDHPERRDTALLIDAPGPDAVAAASVLASLFDPVFLFDNWPHPRGIVASHEVLAAAIYERPIFEDARKRRPANAPPMFVIDSRRLVRYTDDHDSFDNRYLARLPGAAAFQQLGIRHLLYVTDVPVEHETDDLNDDFVALAAAGIDVKMVAFNDFRPVAVPERSPPTPPTLARVRSPSPPPPPPVTPVYTYGGSPYAQTHFWHTYGWYEPAHPSPLPPGARPVNVSGGASYRPVARATMFSSHTVGGLAGFGKQKPSGFGRVSVRTSSSSGAVEVGRSGSFGRSRSYWSGG